MFQQLVVPVDGSAVSWRGSGGGRMACSRRQARVVTVVDRLADVKRQRSSTRASSNSAPGVEPMHQVLAVTRSRRDR
jgi:hypothetical protein